MKVFAMKPFGFFGALALVAILALPLAASAQEGSVEVRFLLRAHHQAPSPEALARATADPVGALMEVALDATESTLVRRRAALMLAGYPEARSERFLVELVDSPNGELRRAGALALINMLSERSPERLIEHLSALLESADPFDREAAVWLLARLDLPAARERLARQRIVERHRAVVDALRRVARGAIAVP
jgi:HEAT repeat protein